MKKRLIICCDGTWNRADQARGERPSPTNVVRLAYRVAKRDEDTDCPQILFYDQGVGTGNRVDRFTGGAFGNGLDDNIFDAYRFLVANYESGDHIFLFGFSRGAFTARSLAGMIRNCGILRRDCVESYAKALAMYQDAEVGPNDPSAKTFRAACSVDGETPTPVQCIGVWDTVGSLGIPLRGLRWVTRGKYQFHDLRLSSTIRHAYQALAIDERRAPFRPTVFWSDTDDDRQTAEQRWFPGVHSDIGGGVAERDISDLTLLWMIRKAEDAGLVFDRSVDLRHPIEAGRADGMIHDSKKGLYRLTLGVDRVIGLRPEDPTRPESDATIDDPTQVLDESVLQRWDARGDYRPKELRKYFGRVGDPRAGR